jgi:predicted esterase
MPRVLQLCLLWRLHTLALACVALCCAGCAEGPPATEVLVVVDGPASTRQALVRLEVQVFSSRDSASARQMRDFDVGPGAHPLPVSFSIAANDQSATQEFRVVVTGFDRNSNAIVEQQVITSFQPNHAGRLDLFLYAGCADLCRAAGALGTETCNADGQCAPVPVRDTLPNAAPTDLGGYTPIVVEPGVDPQVLEDGGQSARSDGSVTSVPPPDANAADGASSTSVSPGTDGGAMGTGMPGEAGPAQSDAGATPTDAGVSDAGPKLDAGPGRDAGSDAGQDASTMDAAIDSGLYARTPVIPAPSTTCPSFVSGTLTIMGVSVQIKAGPRATDATAPLVFYWHSTGGSATELSMLPSTTTTDIMNAGGIIVSPQDSLTGGADISGTGTWSVNDFTLSDLFVACAVRDYNVDPRRIYTAGCSSGGLTAGAMGFLRASYIAASTPNSGGLNPGTAAQVQSGAARAASTMAMHGSAASDYVTISFADTSVALSTQTRASGAFAINCDHGGGHCGAPTELKEAAWQFMKDHPYGLAREPYASGLPASFPSYCSIVP